MSERKPSPTLSLSAAVAEFVNFWRPYPGSVKVFGRQLETLIARASDEGRREALLVPGGAAQAELKREEAMRREEAIRRAASLLMTDLGAKEWSFAEAHDLLAALKGERNALRQRAESAEAEVARLTAEGEALREALYKCDGLFSTIRSDWSDPRAECREGWRIIAAALEPPVATPPGPEVKP